MMTLTITIKCDNASFEDGRELSRILQNLADRAEIRGAADLGGTVLRDINGNTVGRVSVSK